ncbi:hypothetical protein [Humibacter albus]|uniref:hypothetical protein n=1 Tax=Humibacter albus TaxID=427754 RepID=UPI0003B3915F|nr:hypothetical protein [Humibacter albus]
MLTKTEITPQLRAGIAVRVAPTGSSTVFGRALPEAPSVRRRVVSGVIRGHVVLGMVPAAIG